MRAAEMVRKQKSDLPRPAIARAGAGKTTRSDEKGTLIGLGFRRLSGCIHTGLLEIANSKGQCDAERTQS